MRNNILSTVVSLTIVFLLFSPGFADGLGISESASKNASIEIVLKVVPEVNNSDTINSIKNDLKLSIEQSVKEKVNLELAKINFIVLKVPSFNIGHTMKILQMNPLVESVDYNRKAIPFLETNDPDLKDQWGLYSSGFASSGESAWNITNGDPQVLVAVVDSGVDTDHPDLSGKIIKSIDFTDSLIGYDDQLGHGTHMAGTIGALTNNNIGIAGGGYKTRLLNVKVIKDAGYGYYSDISSGIIWATDNGADVINLSLGGTYNSGVLKNAVNYAKDKGVVVVSAAGNSGKQIRNYPAAYKNALSVSSIDEQGNMPSWANFGNWVDVVAPGEDIYGLYKNGQYAYGSGTSMSTSFVSAQAALIISTGNCGDSSSCVLKTIKDTSSPVNSTPSKNLFGEISVYDSVLQNQSTSPTPTLSPTAIPTLVPTVIPTAAPTPTLIPTIVPTLIPTIVPTATPTPTLAPTVTPTPTPKPTKATPTETPVPTVKPTVAPTPIPSPTPTPIIKKNTSKMHIDNVKTWYSGFFGWFSVFMRVTIADVQTGSPTKNAKVKIKLTTPKGRVYVGEGTTNRNGKVTFSLRFIREKGIYKFEIQDVVKKNIEYVSSTTLYSINVK